MMEPEQFICCCTVQYAHCQCIVIRSDNCGLVMTSILCSGHFMISDIWNLIHGRNCSTVLSIPQPNMSVESYDSTTDVKNTPIYNSVPTNDQDYKPRVVTWWGIGTLQPLLITGGAISAGLIALSHHFFDSYLERRYVDGFWDQTMSRRTENAFATVFQILFVFSAGISLCQVVSTAVISR